MGIHWNQRGAPLVLAVGALVFCAAQLNAHLVGEPPILNPKCYVSPSGRYSLYVNPSDLHGRGKASYRLTLDGKEVWSAEKPYTLWDAGVTDLGLAAGYAYSHGPQRDWKAGAGAGVGDFRVVIIDPRGTERLDEATTRQADRRVDEFPSPVAAGLIMDAANDRMIVRIRDDDLDSEAEIWRTFQLSTGKFVAEFRPKEVVADPIPLRHVIDSMPVTGTPLFLLYWRRYDWEKEQKQGASFTLIGRDGKAVWSLDLPADYEAGGDEKEQDRLMTSLRRTGRISDLTGPAVRGSFREGRAAALRSWSPARRAVTGLSRRSNGVPLSRRRPPYRRRPRSHSSHFDLPGACILSCPLAGPEPEIRDIGEFEFDPRGRIAFLRQSNSKSLALSVMDQEGKAICKVLLDSACTEDKVKWSDLACLGLRAYLVLRFAPGDRAMMEGAIVDVETRTITPIPGFNTTVGSKIAGFVDGSFFVLGGLTDLRGGQTSDRGLHAFDRRGKRLWSLPQNGGMNDPDALFGARDLTVTTERMVAVIDASRKTVPIFDRAGKLHHNIDLNGACERRSYDPSGISADRDGGVVVHDFQGDPPIVRMRADETVRAEVRPRMNDGRRLHLSDAQVAPGGALWVSDGQALYRLAESGIVDRVLGEAPDPLRFDRAAAVTLDGRGRIFAAVVRTGAVHVFEPDGRWLRVSAPDASDLADELSFSHLTVSDSGHIYLASGVLGKNRFLHFSSDGRRVGIEESDLGEDWREMVLPTRNGTAMGGRPQESLPGRRNRGRRSNHCATCGHELA